MAHRYYEPLVHQAMMQDHIETKPRSMVFAGMGLGKTAATLYSRQKMIMSGDIKGTLIVAPKRVCQLTWPNEMQKWSMCNGVTGLNLRDLLLKPKSRREELRQARAVVRYKNHEDDFYFISYELLEKFVDRYLGFTRSSELPFDDVVFDEISKAKKHDNVYLESFRSVIMHFGHRVGLTGTPRPNGYLDLFAPFRLIDGGAALGVDITNFRNKYFTKSYAGWGYELRDDDAKAEIQEKISHLTVTLRTEDYLNVPEIDYHDIEFSLPAKARGQYDKLQRQSIINLDDIDKLPEDDDDFIYAQSGGVLVQKLRQLASGRIFDMERVVHEIHDARLKKLGTLLNPLLKQGKPTLIATCFTHEFEAIVAKYPFIQRFNENRLAEWTANKIPFWISDFRSISHGLNLHEGGAHNIIWYTPTYSWEGWEQYNARLRRTGQEEITNVFRLIAKNTIDETIYEILRHKFEGHTEMLQMLKQLEQIRMAA